MHGPRLVSLPVADWLAQTQLSSTTSPTAPTAPGLPDYRTAHRSSSSELGELESEQRELELRVASLSADSRGGRRRDGPPQGKSIIACAIGLCICASTTRVLPSPRTLSPCRPSCRPSPLTPRCSSLSPLSRPLGTGSAQRSLGSLGCCCARQRRGRGPCGSLGASEC